MSEVMGVGRVNYLLRTVVLAAFVGLGYLGYEQVAGALDDQRAEVAARDEQIRELDAQLVVRAQEADALEEDVAERDAQLAELQTAMRFLKMDHRIARLSVLDQQRGPRGRTKTTVRFEELNSDGDVVGETAEYTLPGQVAYIESLVIKFGDDYVEQGDAWRGSSICLFRRLFAETQTPEEGFPLDQVGQPPASYADDRFPDLVSRLWTRFWDYANDPAEAEAVGVRAIHGEAPFIELRPGSSYLVELRSSGGLSLRKE
jgi:hypothetical protein